MSAPLARQQNSVYQPDALIASDIDAYLEIHQHKSMLRFITCGSVDDGKSTLIGRLLYDSKMIFEDQLASLEADSQRIGTQGQEIDFALLVDGVARAALPRETHDVVAFPVLVAAIALAGWPQYARTVRGSTLVEKGKEYVQAARVIGVSSLAIMVRHVLPNVLGPVLVLATVHIATAIITEATLSFLGVGVPPTTPSLGTLIRVGAEFLFSGEWWITIFPGLALVMLVLSVNLLGDWLRDALNPRLR